MRSPDLLRSARPLPISSVKASLNETTLPPALRVFCMNGSVAPSECASARRPWGSYRRVAGPRAIQSTARSSKSLLRQLVLWPSPAGATRCSPLRDGSGRTCLGTAPPRRVWSILPKGSWGARPRMRYGRPAELRMPYRRRPLTSPSQTHECWAASGAESAPWVGRPWGTPREGEPICSRCALF